MDGKKELPAGHWKAFRYDENKSIQQNAGFSHTPEVEESLNIVKKKLTETLDKALKPGDALLDFGCGPGIYMKMLRNKYKVFGVDVSEGMLKQAEINNPDCKLYFGNFMKVNFDEKYDAIYSISVLEYVPVSQISEFFEKCSRLLNKDGIIFIQYPHALRKLDLYYPDRNYICYSPEFISRTASRYFNIIENNQSFDGRDVCVVDTKPYPTTGKTFKNGYLLIARKK
jgi:2-polyprenyl-3-methyl-5-hydroxy-6-metoxy-1,4-benzoquinol methylase